MDCNQAQSALLELKLSAIRQLNHSEFLEVIGIKPSQQRYENQTSSLTMTTIVTTITTVTATATAITAITLKVKVTVFDSSDSEQQQ